MVIAKRDGLLGKDPRHRYTFVCYGGIFLPHLSDRYVDLSDLDFSLIHLLEIKS